ncbi:MAG TPA: FixH family protein, partial [Phycisphaerales bacterium]|nr:FixH family protein [Phycisphaerales bacterium]
MSTPVDGGVGAKSGGIWPGAIFALLGVNVVVVAVTVYFAVTDPSASIEPNYYEKAVRWDESAARRASSGRLGWGVHLELGPTAQGRELLATLRDADGMGIDGARVEVEMFHHARAGDRWTPRLEPRGEGVYAGRLGPV